MKYKDLKGISYEEKSIQEAFLRRLYKSVGGRWVLKILISPVISKWLGIFLDTGISKVLIAPFINWNTLDMKPYVERNYHSYNDFFTREIKPEERMIDCDEAHLISPSDGKVSAYLLDENSRFQIKHTEYTLESLLRSKKLAHKYRNGYAVIIRLSVDNYHRYCYPADGVKSDNHAISGVLHTVNPIACETLPVYKENSRELTLIKSNYFGDLIQMEVGALLVGRICNYHQRGQIKKGQEKGKFEFGGSTIILLLEANHVEVDEVFLQNTKEGYETLIQMGASIGRSLSRKNT